MENFAVHVFCGLIVVHFFVETFNAGTRSIVRNKSLVQKLAMPREMFPVASMLVSLFHVVPQLVILVVVSLAYGWKPDPVGIVALFLALGISMILGAGAGAAVQHGQRVLPRLLQRGQHPDQLHPLRRADDLPLQPGRRAVRPLGEYYLWNPIADAVLLVQRGFWVGTTENPEQFAATDLPPEPVRRGCHALGLSLVLLVLAQLVFSRFEQRIPERL